MTAVESLRCLVATELNLWPIIDFKDTAMVLADACEEAGDERGAEFWRLVAARKVWPLHKEGGKHFEWWKWSEHIDHWWGKKPPYGVAPAVFDHLPGKNRLSPSPLCIRYYRSLSKAVLSLEKAWGAVDCEAASVYDAGREVTKMEKKCERCGGQGERIKTGPFTGSYHALDYCALCSKDLCQECMAKGCCKKVPAVSGMESDYPEE